MDKVYVILISHPSGQNYYAAKTEAGMYKQVADYCRIEWTEDCRKEYGDLPEDDKAAIEMYFADDLFGDRESWQGEIVELHE